MNAMNLTINFLFSATEYKIKKVFATLCVTIHNSELISNSSGLLSHNSEKKVKIVKLNPEQQQQKNLNCEIKRHN